MNLTIRKHIVKAALGIALASSLFAGGSAAADTGQQLSGRTGPAAGPVIPVEGPDGLLWICREDEEEKQSICLPWFQEMVLDDSVLVADDGGSPSSSQTNDLRGKILRIHPSD